MEDKYSLFEARFARLFIIIFLCLIVYIVEVKSKLLQTEQYAWPKMLNRMTADSEKFPVVPCTFKVPDYAEKLENNETWTSPPFAAVFKHGYTTWLSVTFIKDKGITVSFFFQRTDNLFAWHWPRNAMFSLELLNQQYDSNHYFIPYLIDIKDCYYVNDATIRYTTGFISAKFLDELPHQYFKSGNAYLRVSHDKTIYNYVEWFMRQYFNMTISNYPTRLLWIISILLIIEFQALCSAQLKESFGHFNETLLWIFEIFSTFLLFYILFNLGILHM